jgi:predicted PurR-regulated permease PerM
LEREDPRRRTLYLAVVGAVVFYLGYLARDAVVPLLVALLLAYVLAPLVATLQRKGLSRIGAVTALFVAFFGTVGAGLALGVPPLLDQGRALLRAGVGEPVRTLSQPPPPSLERMLDQEPPAALLDYLKARDLLGAAGEKGAVPGNFERRTAEQREERGEEGAAEFRLRHAGWLLGQYEGRAVAYEDRNHNGRFDPGYLFKFAMTAAGYARDRAGGESFAAGIEDIGIDSIPGIAQSVVLSGSDVVRGALGAVGPFLRVLAWLLILPMYTFYFLMRLEDVWRAFVGALPGSHRDRVVKVLHEIHLMLIGFFRGRLLTMLLKGLLAGVLLGAVGVPYWPVFGAAAGLLTIVPAVGPLAVAVPGVWLTYSVRGGIPAGLAAGVFIALEVVESYVLIPRLIGREVGLHPMAVVTAILVGGALLGGFGVVIAIPLAASAKIVWGEFVLPAIRAKAAEPPRGPEGGPPAPPGNPA